VRKYLLFSIPTYLLPSLLYYFLLCSFFFIVSYSIVGIFIISVCRIPFPYFLSFYLFLFISYFLLSLMLYVSHFYYFLRFSIFITFFLISLFLYIILHSSPFPVCSLLLCYDSRWHNSSVLLSFSLFLFPYALFFVFPPFLCVRCFCVMIRVDITPVFVLSFSLFLFLYALFFVLPPFLCVRCFCVTIRVDITPVFVLRFQRIFSSVLSPIQESGLCL
jgi:hypothetical protein